MTTEQERFERLSNDLAKVKDQASARFRDISSDMIESQNRLSLLMTRNLYCFNLVSPRPSFYFLPH